MKVVILLIGILIFTAYFYAIGAGYWALLPIAVFLLGIMFLAHQHKDKIARSEIDHRYRFQGVWIVVNIAIVFLLHSLWIGVLEGLLWILGLNILVLLSSYMTRLPYAEDIAYTTYFLVAVAIIVYAGIHSEMSLLLTIQYLLGFTTAFLAFLYFIVPLFYPITEGINIHLFLSCFATVAMLVYDQISNPYYAIVGVLWLLTLLILGIYYSMHRTHSIHKIPSSPEDIKQISVRKILAGERVLPLLKEKPQHHAIADFFYTIFTHFPPYAKYLFEGANVFLLGLFIYQYVRFAITTTPLWWIHWGIVGLFLINIYLFKVIGYTSILQKIGMFLGLNIFVTIVLFSLMPQITDELVGYAVVRNSIYAIGVFNLDILFPRLTWKRSDYLTAIGVDGLMSVANIVLLTYLSFSWEVIFALAFLYLAVKILMILYTLNKLKYLSGDTILSESHQE